MSFTGRHLDVTVQLGEGSFGTSGQNTVELQGFRANATIHKSGGQGPATLDLRLFGVNPDITKRVATLAKPITTQGFRNVVTVSARSDGEGAGVAFIGTILTAWEDLNAAPDTSLLITAQTGMFDALRPLPPTSFKGSADVATILASLAQQMGYTFENNGVSVQLSNQYLAGTGRQQAFTAAQNAHINITIDDQPNATPTLAIWPKDGTRNAVPVALSKTTGMIGYPTWTDNGLIVRSLYNPSLVFGAQVQITSDVANANGTWQIFDVTHELDGDYPDGKWFTTLQCTVLGHASVAA